MKSIPSDNSPIEKMKYLPFINYDPTEKYMKMYSESQSYEPWVKSYLARTWNISS